MVALFVCTSGVGYTHADAPTSVESVSDDESAATSMKSSFSLAVVAVFALFGAAA